MERPLARGYNRRIVSTKSNEEITRWLVERIAQELKLEPAQIPLDVNLGRYGLDSIRAIEITTDLSKWLGLEVSSTAMWDYDTVNALVAGIADGGALAKR